jgi:hypothetical protein
MRRDSSNVVVVVSPSLCLYSNPCSHALPSSALSHVRVACCSSRYSARVTSPMKSSDVTHCSSHETRSGGTTPSHTSCSPAGPTVSVGRVVCSQDTSRSMHRQSVDIGSSRSILRNGLSNETCRLTLVIVRVSDSRTSHVDANAFDEVRSNRVEATVADPSIDVDR